MTPTEESAEILRNAHAACDAGEITQEQKRDVWQMLITDLIERMVLEQWTKDINIS